MDGPDPTVTTLLAPGQDPALFDIQALQPL
jgi:hypothetical protein